MQLYVDRCIRQGERVACVTVSITLPHEKPHAVFGGFNSRLWRVWILLCKELITAEGSAPHTYAARKNTLV